MCILQVLWQQLLSTPPVPCSLTSVLKQVRQKQTKDGKVPEVFRFPAIVGDILESSASVVLVTFLGVPLCDGERTKSDS